MHKINQINCGFVTAKAKWTDLAAVAFYYPELTVKKKKYFSESNRNNNDPNGHNIRPSLNLLNYHGHFLV